MQGPSGLTVHVPPAHSSPVQASSGPQSSGVWHRSPSWRGHRGGNTDAQGLTRPSTSPVARASLPHAALSTRQARAASASKVRAPCLIACSARVCRVRNAAKGSRSAQVSASTQTVGQPPHAVRLRHNASRSSARNASASSRTARSRHAGSSPPSGGKPESWLASCSGRELSPQPATRPPTAMHMRAKLSRERRFAAEFAPEAIGRRVWGWCSMTPTLPA